MNDPCASAPVTLPNRPFRAFIILRIEEHFPMPGLHSLLIYGCGPQGPDSHPSGPQLSTAGSGAFCSCLSRGSGGLGDRSTWVRRTELGLLLDRVPPLRKLQRRETDRAYFFLSADHAWARQSLLCVPRTGTIPPGAASSSPLLPPPPLEGFTCATTLHVWHSSGTSLRGPKSSVQLLEPQPCCCTQRR